MVERILVIFLLCHKNAFEFYKFAIVKYWNSDMCTWEIFDLSFFTFWSISSPRIFFRYNYHVSGKDT